VAEYAEMKVGILVKNRAFRINVGAEVPGNEVPIGARLLGKLANALATGAASIPEKRGPAIGGKLIQRVGHDHSSSYFAEFRATELTKLTSTKRVPFSNLLPICWNEQMPANGTSGHAELRAEPCLLLGLKRTFHQTPTMSALGQKQTLASMMSMSALPQKRTLAIDRNARPVLSSQRLRHPLAESGGVQLDR
jgi:hypothetical protein